MYGMSMKWLTALWESNPFSMPFNHDHKLNWMTTNTKALSYIRSTNNLITQGMPNGEEGTRRLQTIASGPVHLPGSHKLNVK